MTPYSWDMLEFRWNAGGSGLFFCYVSDIVLGSCVFHFAAFEGFFMFFLYKLAENDAFFVTVLFSGAVYFLIRHRSWGIYWPYQICGLSNLFWALSGYLGWHPSPPFLATVEKQHAALKPSKVWLSGASCVHLWWVRNVPQQQWLQQNLSRKCHDIIGNGALK